MHGIFCYAVRAERYEQQCRQASSAVTVRQPASLCEQVAYTEQEGASVALGGGGQRGGITAAVGLSQAVRRQLVHRYQMRQVLLPLLLCPIPTGQGTLLSQVSLQQRPAMSLMASEAATLPLLGTVRHCNAGLTGVASRGRYCTHLCVRPAQGLTAGICLLSQPGRSTEVMNGHKSMYFCKRW